MSPDGAAGQPLHGGAFYGRDTTHAFRASGVNIGWALRDVRPELGEGGLMIVAASHKARYPLPRTRGYSCDLPNVRLLELKAGSAVLYNVTHGVQAWRAAEPRRFVTTVALPNLRGPKM